MKRVVAYIGFALAVAACGSTAPALPIAAADTQRSGRAPRGSGPLPITGTAISPDGRWPCESGDGDLCVEGATITTNDPACFVDWDASGLCKQYQPGGARGSAAAGRHDVGRAVSRGVRSRRVPRCTRRKMGVCAGSMAGEARQPDRDAWTDNPDRRAVVRIAAAVHARSEHAAGLTVAAQFPGLRFLLLYTSREAAKPAAPASSSHAYRCRYGSMMITDRKFPVAFFPSTSTSVLSDGNVPQRRPPSW